MEHVLPVLPPIRIRLFIASAFGKRRAKRLNRRVFLPASFHLRGIVREGVHKRLIVHQAIADHFVQRLEGHRFPIRITAFLRAVDQLGFDRRNRRPFFVLRLFAVRPQHIQLIQKLSQRIDRHCRKVDATIQNRSRFLYGFRCGQVLAQHICIRREPVFCRFR